MTHNEKHCRKSCVNMRTTKEEKKLLHIKLCHSIPSMGFSNKIPDRTLKILKVFGVRQSTISFTENSNLFVCSK